MAGAAMRALYESAAKERIVEGQKKGGIEKSKKAKNDSCLVALLPPSTSLAVKPEQATVPKSASI